MVQRLMVQGFIRLRRFQKCRDSEVQKTLTLNLKFVNIHKVSNARLSLRIP